MVRKNKQIRFINIKTIRPVVKPLATPLIKQIVKRKSKLKRRRKKKTIARKIKFYKVVATYMSIRTKLKSVAFFHLPTDLSISFSNSLKQTLYGIGLRSANKLISTVYCHPNTRLRRIQRRKLQAITITLSKSFNIADNLYRDTYMNIDKLKQIKCYRGNRHLIGLPCRGQRTHTNAGTINHLFRLSKI